MTYLITAKSVIKNEIDGILEVEQKLDSSFESFVKTIASSKGRVVMCGMGKSGHIAKKIFATLVSTGTPSMFMHPAEAFHGDLGMIQAEDVFFAISNSGETSEVTQLLPFIRNNGNKLLSMTGNPLSTIAKVSDYHIDIGISQEACPLNLAPTTSTTVSLVMGDAIAVALMEKSNFKIESFAKFHPGGSLGKKLLHTVGDFSRKAVFVESNINLLEVLNIMISNSSGLVLVGSSNDLQGIITDGDIRKALALNGNTSVMEIIASDIMTTTPKKISPITKCGDADAEMERLGVNSLIISADGVIGIYDNLNRK